MSTRRKFFAQRSFCPLDHLKMSFLVHLSHRIQPISSRCMPAVVKRSISSVDTAVASPFHENDNMTDLTRHLLEELSLNERDSASPEEIRFRRRMALARSITLVESTAASHRKQADLLLTHLLSNKSGDNAVDDKKFFRVGIAGPPGAYMTCYHANRFHCICSLT